MINNPAQTAINPIITLARIYKNMDNNSPFKHKLYDSKEKVEKVVNPPQKPTIKKAFILASMIPVLFIIPLIIPNKKHPKILIVKVANG